MIVAIDGPSGSGKSSIAHAIADRFGLTAREADIMGLYAQGRSRAFISAQLVISENTVRDHLKYIYRKLDVHNKQELIDLIEGR